MRVPCGNQRCTGLVSLNRVSRSTWREREGTQEILGQKDCESDVQHWRVDRLSSELDGTARCARKCHGALPLRLWRHLKTAHP